MAESNDQVVPPENEEEMPNSTATTAEESEQRRPLERGVVGESEKSLDLFQDTTTTTTTATTTQQDRPSRATAWGRPSPPTQQQQQQPKHTLAEIMQQEEEAAAKKRAAAEQEDARLSELQQEEQLMMLAMERSLADIQHSPTTTTPATPAETTQPAEEEEIDPIVQAAQEEELVQLAMEMSLSDVGGVDLVTQQQQQQQQQQHSSFSNHQSHNSDSYYASATQLDMARRVQAESETTEGFVESPHLTKTSSRRFLVRPPPTTSPLVVTMSPSGKKQSSNPLRTSLPRWSPGRKTTMTTTTTMTTSPKRITTPKTTAVVVATSPSRSSTSTSSSSSAAAAAVKQPPVFSERADLEQAANHLSATELDQIAKALQEADQAESSSLPFSTNPQTTTTKEDSKMPAHSSLQQQDSSSSNRSLDSNGSGPQLIRLRREQQQQVFVSTAAVARKMDEPHAHITPEDTAEIERALREADEEEERKSIQLALQMLEEDNQIQQSQQQQQRASQHQQGNVRTMSRAEFEQQQRNARVGAFHTNSPPRMRHPLEENDDDDNYDDNDDHVSSGFRMNTQTPQQWSRRDQHSIVGPNNQIRTKHDTSLQGIANAHRLGLDEEDAIMVGNKAYNSFLKSVRRTTNKGVVAHGTGRAGSDADSTKGGAMDPAVRIGISRAVNNGLIEKCNGVVKEGKEAIVYHADRGAESGGFDVAVKVFKRIQEFRARGDYVDGDPRYARASFRNASSREQLTLWAEKEMRNLLRANRAGVPVPTPLLTKENIIFMRFLGTDGWPSPQLREVNLRRGSKRWLTLYNQVVFAMRKLYQGARLVHGDLSEYNILVAPASLVENREAGVEVDDLQAVFIDFGQAVDVRHPEALELLERDMGRVQSFFKRVGVEVMSKEEALSMVIGSEYPYEGAAEAMKKLNWSGNS